MIETLKHCLLYLQWFHFIKIYKNSHYILAFFGTIELNNN